MTPFGRACERSSWFPSRATPAAGPLNSLEGLARIYANVGEQDLAIDVLEQLLAIPSRISVGSLRVDPEWDGLRSNPRFQVLLAKHDEPSRN